MRIGWTAAVRPRLVAGYFIKYVVAAFRRSSTDFDSAVIGSLRFGCRAATNRRGLAACGSGLRDARPPASSTGPRGRPRVGRTAGGALSRIVDSKRGNRLQCYTPGRQAGRRPLEHHQDPPIVAGGRMVGGSWSPGGPKTPRVPRSSASLGGSRSLFGPDPDLVRPWDDDWRIVAPSAASLLRPEADGKERPAEPTPADDGRKRTVVDMGMEAPCLPTAAGHGRKRPVVDMGMEGPWLRCVDTTDHRRERPAVVDMTG
jgi:hypothetical protein